MTDRPISGEIIAITEKAILLEVQNFGEIWIPKSLMKEEYITIEMPLWWLKKKGL